MVTYEYHLTFTEEETSFYPKIRGEDVYLVSKSTTIILFQVPMSL